MSGNKADFGAILRKVRENQNLSQSDLAKKSGFEPSAISHFETGKRAPSFENLKRLADALSVSIDYLLGRTEEPSSSGPVAEKLFRNFGNMSAEDQDTISKMVEMLAKKNKE